MTDLLDQPSRRVLREYDEVCSMRDVMRDRYNRYFARIGREIVWQYYLIESIAAAADEGVPWFNRHPVDPAKLLAAQVFLEFTSGSWHTEAHILFVSQHPCLGIWMDGVCDARRIWRDFNAWDGEA